MIQRKIGLLILIWLMVLPVWAVVQSIEQVDVCASALPYTWHGTDYYEAGKHIDTVSGDTLYLTIHTNHYFPENATCCPEDLPYRWRGQTFSETGTYESIEPAEYGCDNIYTLNLYVPAKKEDEHVTETFCEKEGFEWDGQRYYEQKTFIEYRQTIPDGCTYKVYHHFVPQPQFFKSEFIQHYADTCVTWRGHTYCTDGVYRELSRKEGGCDSVFELHLATKYDVYIHYLNCDGDVVEHKGKKITSDCDIVDKLLTRLGADSIIHHQFRFRTTVTKQDEITICSNTEVEWEGHVDAQGNPIILSKAGSYYDTLRYSTAPYCDSVRFVRVVKTGKYLKTDSIVVVCNDELAAHGGCILYTDSKGETHRFCDENTDKTLMDTLTHMEGCVQIRAFRVIITDRCSPDSIYPFCDGDSVLIDGIYYKQEGHYRNPFQSSRKLKVADSVHRFTVARVYPDTFYLDTTICESQLPFHFKGKVFSKHQSDTYLIRLPNPESPCDSLWKLTLTVIPTVVQTYHHAFCPGESFTIHTRTGRVITQTGLYKDTVSYGPYDCDSVFIYDIKDKPTFFQSQLDYMVEGATYVWRHHHHDTVLTEAKVYYDSLVNRSGCDSVYQLDLRYAQAFYHHLDTTVCQASLPLYWHQQWLDSAGAYEYKGKTAYNLDSIYTIDLHVVVPRDSSVVETYCQGERPTIGGRVITSTTHFVDTIPNVHSGCDSIYINYSITFTPQYEVIVPVQLLPGEEYWLGDTIITTAGEYRRKLIASGGCDSLVTLIVTTCPNSVMDTVYKHFCYGDVYLFNNQEEITESSTRYTYAKRANGCDSITIYYINFYHSENLIQVASTCSGESYTWHRPDGKDTVLTRAGTYTYTETSSTPAKCLNTFTLKLQYRAKSVVDSTISFCRGEHVDFRGIKIYEDTVIEDLLGINQYGCDSLMRWHFQVNDHCSDYDFYTRCSNQIITIKGIPITHAGEYAVHYNLGQGRDSIYRFIVNDIVPTERHVYPEPACDSLLYNEVWYYAVMGKDTIDRTFYTRSLGGCDSLIEHVHMVIYSSAIPYLKSATIADFETYIFDGQTYNQEGVYTNYHHTIHGCDSVRTLDLKVLPTQRPDPVVYTFCHGDKAGVEVFGKIYYPTKDTLVSDTCYRDGLPMIRQAYLKEHYPFTISHIDVHSSSEVCSSNKVYFDISYEVKEQGFLPESYDVDFIAGDLPVSPMHATYPVNRSQDLTIEIDGKGSYVAPGEYTYRLTFYTESCHQSDTAFTQSVLVRYPAEMMEANWNNAVMLLNENFNPGHWALQPPYTWQVYDSYGQNKSALVAPSDPTQAYLASDALKEGDQIVVYLRREDYPKSIPSCTFLFHAETFNPYQHPIIIYPTVTETRGEVQVRTTQSGSYQLYNTTGHACEKGMLPEGMSSLTMPGQDGCYLIQVRLQDGTEQIQRVIVY